LHEKKKPGVDLSSGDRENLHEPSVPERRWPFHWGRRGRNPSQVYSGGSSEPAFSRLLGRGKKSPYRLAARTNSLVGEREEGGEAASSGGGNIDLALSNKGGGRGAINQGRRGVD